MPYCCHNTDESPSSGCQARSGVVMIEAAMAVLVLAIGVIAVFVLFQSGLKRSEESLTDTQVALFAANVLDGVKAEAVRALESTDTNAWDNFWLAFDSGSIPIKTSNVWLDPVDVTPEVTRTNIYRNYPFHGTSTNIVNHVLRYRLEVDPITVAGTNAMALTLRIWPGEFGPMSPEKAAIFYTELRQPDNWSF